MADEALLVGSALEFFDSVRVLDRALTDTHRFVLETAFAQANETTIKEAAQRSNLSGNYVSRMLADMERARVLERHRKKGKKVGYQIVPALGPVSDRGPSLLRAETVAVKKTDTRNNLNLLVLETEPEKKEMRSIGLSGVLLRDILKVDNYPQLKLVRLLYRSPDTQWQVTGRYNVRKGEMLETLLNVYRTHHDKTRENTKVRFYAQEPVLKGTSLSYTEPQDKKGPLSWKNETLSLSIYSSLALRKKTNIGTGEWGWSSSAIPTLIMDNKPFGSRGDYSSAGMVDAFDQAFDLIWKHCTRFRAIILDLDGTLYKDEKLTRYMSWQLGQEYLESRPKWKKQAEEFRKRANEASFDDHTSTSEVLRLTGTQNPSQYMEWKTGKEITEDNLREYDSRLPERNEKLAKLMRNASEHFSLVLLSNSASKHARIILQSLGIEESTFDAILTPDVTGLVKPDKAFFFELTKALLGKVDPRNFVFVGDRPGVDFELKDVALACVHVNGPEQVCEFLEHATQSPIVLINDLFRHSYSMEVRADLNK